MAKSYLDEINEQPDILRRLSEGLDDALLQSLLNVRSGLEDGTFDRVVITGMGGSLHGAYPAFLTLSKSLTQPVLFYDTSELTQQCLEVITSKTLLIVVSQSGESGEILDLIEAVGETPGQTVSVTNMSGNSLSNWADIAACSNAGHEATVSTKSYTGGFAALFVVTAILSGQDYKGALSAVAQAADATASFLGSWEGHIEPAAEFLGAKDPVMFVGRGPSFGSAQIAGLLTQEAAKLQCTALSGGQFRHGPIELVRDRFSMMVFLGDKSTRHIDEALIAKVTSHGGRVVAVCPANHQVEATDKVHVLSLPNVTEELIPLVEALPVQLMQIPLSIARGFKPGAFLNASKVTAVV